MSPLPAVKHQVHAAVRACEEKNALELSILQMEKRSGVFTDYFVICSGSNPRQVQAIADEVELRLKHAGVHPTHSEGYRQAEWVLLDYVDFVVHIFSEKARRFYDLERLWKSARRLTPAEVLTPAKAAKPRKPARTARKPGKRTASRRSARSSQGRGGRGKKR
jgi:ribosome-associated protein